MISVRVQNVFYFNSIFFFMEFEVFLFTDDETKTEFTLSLEQSKDDIKFEYKDSKKIPFLIDSLKSFSTAFFGKDLIAVLDGLIHRKIQFRDENGLSNFVSFISKIADLNPITLETFEIKHKQNIDQHEKSIFHIKDSLNFINPQKETFLFSFENSQEFLWNNPIRLNQEDISTLLKADNTIISFSGFELDNKTTFLLIQNLFLSKIFESKQNKEEMEEKYQRIFNLTSKITKFHWNHNKKLRNYVQNLENNLSQCTTFKSPLTKQIIFNVLLTCM